MKVMKILVILGLGIVLDCGCGKKVRAAYTGMYKTHPTPAYKTSPAYGTQDFGWRSGQGYYY